eukprot:6695567-Prorocentrum_lima.AAC.1
MKVEPDTITYNAAISACEKRGEWVKALELLMGMGNVKVEANTISHNATVSACEKCGEWVKALELLI